VQENKRRFLEMKMRAKVKVIKEIIVAAAMLAAVVPTAATAQALTLPSEQELKSKGIKPLNGEQLKTLLTGNTLYHINPVNGVRIPLLYFADGTRLVRIRGQLLKTTYRIERDMVCEESVVLKREVCRSLYRSADANTVCEEGAARCDYGLDWRSGNPEGLRE
jgi:hypothetical protein